MKQKNGSGSVYFDKNKNGWRARILDANGKTVSKRFTNKNDAEKWLCVIKATMLTGNYVPSTNITVGKWVNEYIEVYCKPNVRLKTYVCYLQTSAHLIPIANIKLQSLTARNVQTFLNNLPINMASSTKHKIYRLLKASYNRAMMVELVNKNPLLGVKPPKIERKPIEVFNNIELYTILDYLRSNANIRWYTLVYFVSQTGVRLGEALGLRITDVHDGKVCINHSLSDVLGVPRDEPPKTSAGRRELVVSDATISLLRQIAGKEYVFHTANETPLRTTNVERFWRDLLAKLNIPYRNFHVLRHTCATTLLANGVPLNDVSAYLGHSKPSHTLNLYGHALPNRTKEIPNIIFRALLPRCSPNE